MQGKSLLYDNAIIMVGLNQSERQLFTSSRIVFSLNT